MKALTLALALMLTSSAAWAGAAFYTGEYISGLNKICLYDHMGSTVALTFPSYAVCPPVVNL